MLLASLTVLSPTLAAADPAGTIGSLGVIGAIDLILGGVVAYLYKRSASQSADMLQALRDNQRSEKEQWDRERASLIDARDDERRRGADLVAAAEARALEERRRADRLADGLRDSVQVGFRDSMAAVTEAQRLLRDAFNRGDT